MPRLPLPLLLFACLACHPTPPANTTVDLPPVDAGTPAQPTDASLLPPRASVADDPTRPVEERCADVFATFRTRIHPGDSAAKVRSVLGRATWLGGDRPIDVLGGEVPVEMTSADQTVVFMCLPKPDPRTGGLPWSPWAIYARLEGRGSKTFGAFLASGGAKKLVEYALCHVDGTGQHMAIERFR